MQDLSYDDWIIFDDLGDLTIGELAVANNPDGINKGAHGETVYEWHASNRTVVVYDFGTSCHYVRSAYNRADKDGMLYDKDGLVALLRWMRS